MNKIPAFPTTQYYDEKPLGVIDGMSLRDYFAARAPTPSEYVHSWSDKDQQEAIYRACAESAYRWADAMLKARQV